MTHAQHLNLLRVLAANRSHDVPGFSLVSPSKAHEILEHGEVRGHALTKKQRGFFGLRAGGQMPTRMK